MSKDKRYVPDYSRLYSILDILAHIDSALAINDGDETHLCEALGRARFECRCELMEFWEAEMMNAVSFYKNQASAMEDAAHE